MKLLIDENLPPGLCNVFALTGIEALHVNDLGLMGGSDRGVWEKARLLGAAIATKDADFVDLAAIRNEGKVVLFKVGNMRIAEVLRFATIRAEMIADFLSSDDRVMVLR